ncbi:hypothetical protein C4F51_02355 [Cellvibrio sp. KB43]|uniref:PEP-CTERM system TPR-repeat lipoprotein n=2 Tax=Cellvibrio polysaccharolyticus TaxID=2082724 RepID=A0A928UZE6_9GAMM|nr:hypothetical protein [Cellvibrio polysaccharolyticus]
MGSMMRKSAFLLSLVIALTACDNNGQDVQAEVNRYERSATAYQQQGQYRAAILEARNAIQLQPGNSAGYILLANIYNKIGVYASTRNLLEPLLEKHPEVFVELAEAYVEGRKFRSAINLLNSGNIRNLNENEQRRAYGIQARAYIALGDVEGFQKTLEKVKAIPGSEGQSAYLSAEFFMAQGNREKAAETLKAALQTGPDHLRSLILAGQIEFMENHLDAAEAHLTRALTLTANGDVLTAERATILDYLTQVLIQQGRTSEAYAYQRLLADSNNEGELLRKKYADALELYQQGKLEESAKLLQEIRSLSPTHTSAGTLLGLIQYQQGDNEEAVELFNQYLDTETASSSLIQAAAMAKYQSNNNIQDAIGLLRDAANRQPEDANIQASLGLALLEADPVSQQGADAIEKSLSLNPAQQRLRLALAKRQMTLGDKEGAIGQLETAYKTQPEDLAVQQTYLSTLLAEGRENRVDQEIQAFKKQYPDNVRGAFLEGWFRLHQKKYAEARSLFGKTLKNPDSPDRAIAYMGLAQTWERENQWAKAAEVWSEALTDMPGQIEGYSQWMNALEKSGNSQQAIPFLTKLEEKGAWQTSVMLSQLTFNDGNIEKAIEHIQLALEKSEHAGFVRNIAADLYNRLAIRDRSQGKIPEAKISFLKALEYNPSNINYLANLVDTELFTNNAQEANRLLDAFKPQEEDKAAWHYLKGLIHRAAEETGPSLEAFQTSWAVKPTESAAEAIFSAHQAAGNTAGRDEWLNEWLNKLPNSAKATLVKAMQYQQAGNLKEAEVWYQRSIEISADSVIAFNNLAWIYHEQKDKRALEYAKRAYDLAPQSPVILDTYGWMLVNAGSVKEGVAYLEQAEKIAPDNADVKEHLQKARQQL